MPSIAATSSKKRKRDDPTHENLSFELDSSSSTGTGPLLVSFPSLQAPKDTPFKRYGRRKARKDNQKDTDDDGGKYERTLVVGEAPAVEFISNEEESRRAADSGCSYLLAVHDPRTSKIKILPSQKTPYILTRTVKALKSIPPADAPSSLAYREARTALGETFGTKKAKAAIRAQERNRVDVNAMKGVMQHVVDGIDEKAEGLLTKDEAKDLADSARLVPPFSATATDPGDIYSLNDIIPDAEMKALNITLIEQNLKHNDHVGMLPWKHCKWVNNHIKRLGQEEDKSKARKRKLKMLLYVSTMFLFRRVIGHPKGLDKDSIYEKMNNVPTIVVDGLLSRFTEMTRGSSVHILTSAMSTKFMAYLLALCLRVDDFVSNPKNLADDLSLSIANIQAAYRGLGCKLKTLTERERANRGLSDTLADTKFAVLTAPVQFPKVRTAKKKS
ncbi:Rpa49 subunit specific to nuclear RNA polymerase I [Lentinula guzmanii]|uniref:Rpa49 subunit specific to nuclear RNA polymerase I n=2 Tax=Lentinula TaxID=5352 RepID=A0AA38MYV2_9AGAR|nr:Rpa49 subunit specific to nuclear RNA polymerase I [Lentinula guzmanii]KAJ3784972.1 Rpa49 subunit specific to nuclear RNA polymerase I [Lentinula aff. detonsa]KAJ3799552.1 Rpa49 subunit specific to nuclear RNA polymerase I [Lentinula aff. detonsa]